MSNRDAFFCGNAAMPARDKWPLRCRVKPPNEITLWDLRHAGGGAALGLRLWGPALDFIGHAAHGVGLVARHELLRLRRQVPDCFDVLCAPHGEGCDLSAYIAGNAFRQGAAYVLGLATVIVGR
jgi:hypothetical protein